MSSIPFVKAEGLGNDFLVVDLRPGQPAAGTPAAADPAVVRALCDRHFGVGADGVLAILSPVQGDARMRVINADGSEANVWQWHPLRRQVSLRGILAAPSGASHRHGRGLAGMPDRRAQQVDQTVAVEMGRPQLNRPDPGRGAGQQASGEKPVARR